MRLVVIDIEQLLHLDTWDVPAVPAIGALIELHGKNWKVESVKWVKSVKEQEAHEVLKRFLGKAGTNFTVNEVFVAVFVSRFKSDREGIRLPLLTSESVRPKPDEKSL